MDVPTEPDGTELARSDPSVAVIYSFFQVFAESLHVDDFTPEELEAALLDEEENELIGRLHAALMEKGSGGRSRGTNWQTSLRNLLTKIWGQPDNFLSDAEYRTLKFSQKVEILSWLINYCLDESDAIKKVMNEGNETDLYRVYPFGLDAAGRVYWYLGEETISSRLYVEEKVEYGEQGSWDVACTTMEELHGFAARFASSEDANEQAMYQRIMIDLIPNIEKCIDEKAHKIQHEVKQQKRLERLNHTLNLTKVFPEKSIDEGAVYGRSQRKRKQVNYNFDKFEDMIEEAIDDTETRHSRRRRGKSPPTQNQTRTARASARAARFGVSDEMIDPNDEDPYQAAAIAAADAADAAEEEAVEAAEAAKPSRRRKRKGSEDDDDEEYKDDMNSDKESEDNSSDADYSAEERPKKRQKRAPGGLDDEDPDWNERAERRGDQPGKERSGRRGQEREASGGERRRRGPATIRRFEERVASYGYGDVMPDPASYQQAMYSRQQQMDYYAQPPDMRSYAPPTSHHMGMPAASYPLEEVRASFRERMGVPMPRLSVQPSAIDSDHARYNASPATRAPQYATHGSQYVSNQPYQGGYGGSPSVPSHQYGGSQSMSSGGAYSSPSMQSNAYGASIPSAYSANQSLPPAYGSSPSMAGQGYGQSAGTGYGSSPSMPTSSYGGGGASYGGGQSGGGGGGYGGAATTSTAYGGAPTSTAYGGAPTSTSYGGAPTNTGYGGGHQTPTNPGYPTSLSAGLSKNSPQPPQRQLGNGGYGSPVPQYQPPRQQGYQSGPAVGSPSWVPPESSRPAANWTQGHPGISVPSHRSHGGPMSPHAPSPHAQSPHGQSPLSPRAMQGGMGGAQHGGYPPMRGGPGMEMDPARGLLLDPQGTGHPGVYRAPMDDQHKQAPMFVVTQAVYGGEPPNPEL